ncbi:UNVERIFIED_CONTAM: hypothetical protein Sangu_3200100 [Sesamum angustifolium]|uniref:Uncharacterized protein n=1 Tax=Sesamum angustifolium TaxID=2727405 RepID=A0AAW2JL40_9LAMI
MRKRMYRQMELRLRVLIRRLRGVESANETHVEDDENAMQDECDSARGAGQTNEDEDDGLMSGYSSDDP